MLDYVRPTIAYGNDFHMLITMEQFIGGELFEFDLTKCKQVRVYLTCAIHNTEIQLPFEIVEPNVIDAFVDYRMLHCTSYGICVEGLDDNDQHWKWTVLPREGILIIPNTSGQKIPEEVRYIDIHGRVGFGIDLSDYVKYEYLGDHYYSKEETNALLEGKQDVLVDSGDDQNIKTINGQSILGAGNITIEQATQQQANWTEQDTSAVSYIQNKPDLSIYATTSSLSTVATSGDYNDLLNKPTIPDAPVQSDWNETGTSSLAYILNKPDMSNYATTSALADKQDVLVSGSNIKTINNESILGSGNIAIQAGNSVVDYVIDYSKRYFTIKSLEDDNNITWNADNENVVKTISVSTDDGATWTQYTSSTSGTTIATLNDGEYIFVKGSNTAYGSSGFYNNNRFLFSKNAEVEGNIMSLVYGDNFIGQTTLSTSYTFGNLFNGNIKLINAENLVLPATTLARACYYFMFSECSSLTTAPALPATIMYTDCYCYMFKGCSSLTTAPALPATTLAQGCYDTMFFDCTSLKTAPALPATTLALYCYKQMFGGCSLLNFVKCLATNISAQGCTLGWLSNVSSTGTFITSDTPPVWSRDASGIPVGWNVYTEAEWDYVHNYQLANYATTSALANKQDVLISGSNIKTINNESILGSGNIAIQAGSSGMEPFDTGWVIDQTTDDFMNSAQHASLGHIYTGQVEFTDAPFTTPTEAQVTITNDYGQYGLTMVIDVFEDNTHWQYVSYAENPGTWNSVAYSSSIPAAPVQSDWNETGTSSLAYIKNKPDLSNYATTSSLSTVATSGDYDDLLNKPTIPDAPVQSDWNETGTSSLAYILNKPDLSNYATTSALANKQDTLVSGVNIKTINSESILGSGNIAISAGGNSGFNLVTNPSYSTRTGVVNAVSLNYDTNIGTGAVIEGEGQYVWQKIGASGQNAHAEGNSTTASGQNAHAEGYATTASGQNAHTEGNNTTASGNNAHAEGDNTHATATGAHAEGNTTWAMGNYCHVEGDNTEARGVASHSEGYQCSAQNNYEHAEGKNNSSTKTTNNFGDSGNTLSSIGNGSNISNNHNAFEVRQNGDIYYADTTQIDNSTYYYYNCPTRKLQDVMVTSTTAGVKIEVVNAMPAFPDNNALYIII